MADSANVVIFGAGSAGKGLLGLLCHQAGLRILFVDIDPDLVRALERAGRYAVRVHRLEGGHRDTEVDGFSVLPAQERRAVAEAVVAADWVLTAVFARNLPDVARTLALAAGHCRRAERRRPLHVIACENVKQGSHLLAGHVTEHLAAADRPYVRAHWAFPDCMINRVVPQARDPLHVETEDYCEWTADREALRIDPSAALPFVEWVTNQDARLDRKLMVYNGTHAATAYLGHLAGHTWLHEAAADPRLVPHIEGTLSQLAGAVQQQHGFSPENLAAYGRDFWRRCRNPGLQDPIARIARQPARKLGRYERLIAPAKLAQAHGLPRDHILAAVRAALAYRHPGDPESQDLAASLETQGLRATLARVAGLETHDPLLDELETTALPDLTRS